MSEAARNISVPDFALPPFAEFLDGGHEVSTPHHEAAKKMALQVLERAKKSGHNLTEEAQAAVQLLTEEVRDLQTAESSLDSETRAARWFAISDSIRDLLKSRIPVKEQEQSATIEQQQYIVQAQALLDTFTLAEAQQKINPLHEASYRAWADFATSLIAEGASNVQPDPLYMQQMATTAQLLEQFVKAQEPEVRVTRTRNEPTLPVETLSRTALAETRVERKNLPGVQQALDALTEQFNAISDHLTPFEKQRYRDMRAEAIQASNKKETAAQQEAFRLANATRGFLNGIESRLETRVDVRDFIARQQEQTQRRFPTDFLANATRKKVSSLFGIYIDPDTNRPEGRISTKKSKSLMNSPEYKALMQQLRELESAKRNVHRPKRGVMSTIKNWFR